MIILNSLSLPRIINYTTGYESDGNNTIFCKCRVYLYVLSIGLMRQCLCLISIDRWIVTNQNFQIHRYSSMVFVRRLIFVNVVFWLLYSLHAFIGFEVSFDRGCSLVPGSMYSLFYAILFSICSFVSFVILNSTKYSSSSLSNSIS